MSIPVDPQVSRRLALRLTYKGAAREITATLAHGDRLEFRLAGFDELVGALPMAELFWQAMRSNPAKGKHPLQPHTGQGARLPGKRGKKPDAHYAREYGVSTGVVAMWRRAGAPLANPDAMGDYIFTIKLRKDGRGNSPGQMANGKRRKAVLR